MWWNLLRKENCKILKFHSKSFLILSSKLYARKNKSFHVDNFFLLHTEKQASNIALHSSVNVGIFPKKKREYIELKWKLSARKKFSDERFSFFLLCFSTSSPALVLMNIQGWWENKQFLAIVICIMKNFFNLQENFMLSKKRGEAAGNWGRADGVWNIKMMLWISLYGMCETFHEDIFKFTHRRCCVRSSLARSRDNLGGGRWRGKAQNWISITNFDERYSTCVCVSYALGVFLL